MPKSRTNKPKLSDHVCEWEGCTTRTRFRRDAKTPLKYCSGEGTPNHKSLAWKRFQENVIAPAAEARAERDAMFQIVLDEAMAAGEAAKAAANPLSSSTGAVITFKPANSAFVGFLRRQAIGDPGESGYVVRFPEMPGSVAQARAIAETLRPLTTSGEALEGLRVTVS